MNARVSAIIAAAETYRILGLYCVPIEPGTKAPKIKEWGKLRIEPEEFPKYWRNGQNAGVLLGIASRFLADADLDDPLAVAIVNQGLIPVPKTGWIFGRPSKQYSHYIYETIGEFSPKAYEDDIDVEANRVRSESDAHMICELRGTKQQTVFPPSRHPSGEQIAWTQDPRKCAPAKSNATEIEARLRRVAVAVLLARHYPARNKGHEVAHYFSGWLGHACGWAESDVAEIMFAAATAAGDPDARDRIRNVGSTYKRIAAGNEQIKQRSSLENLLGVNGPAVCRKIAQWLALKSAHRPAGDRMPREPGDEKAPPKGEIITIIKSRRASEIPREPIDWLWEPYFQRDTLNGLYGNPSVGKGNLGMETIACLTAPRPFPDETPEDFAARGAINVCVLAAEEGAATTIVPRLEAAGANLDRVRIIESIQTERDGMKTGERMLIFQEDIAHVRADLLLHPEEKFLFVDPITSYIGDCNANQDSEVRPLLQLLLNLAEELKITILIVGHFNKISNLVSALDKPSGARAWVAMCRAAWGLFRKSEDRSIRLMANLKLNNAKESSTTRLFTIGEKVIGTKPNGKPWTVSIIEWGEVSEVTADELLAAEQPEAKLDTKGSQFIDKFLAKNGVEQATKVYDAATAEKIPVPTLKRASGAMGIIKYEIPGAGGWYWQHPSCQTPIPSSAENLNKAAIARRYRDMQSAKPLFDNPFDS